MSVKAAINFVQVCNEHTAIIGGRKSITTALTSPSSHATKTTVDIATHCLKLPGNLLSVSVLLDKKKFRTYGHKIGAVNGFQHLQDDGLGKLEPCGGRGQNKAPAQQRNHIHNP